MTADSSRLSQLKMIGARLILVDRVADPEDGCSVAIDDVLGGTLAVDHLLDAPGEGITIVNGHRSIPQCEDRRTGARAALEARGVDPDSMVEFEVEDMTIEAGVAIGHRIATTGAPRRIFCINDQLAIGVIRGLAAEGIETPADASVVGYGDLALETEGALPLTTVGQPKREMGDAAVGKLLAELQEGTAHRHTTTIFDPHLIVRGSTSVAN